MMKARNRLVLDTDGGVDDAQALVMLVGNGVVPDAITTVFGNVGLQQATANMLAVNAVLGVDIPVYAGALAPLVQAIVDGKRVHGEDGLGGAPRPATTARRRDMNAVDFLREIFRQGADSGEKIDILMIGPLTNLALALRTEPGIAAGIGRLTIMGGTLAGRGNVTATAEFNIFADPEAGSIVLTAGLDTLLVPWETCVAHRMSGAQIDALYAQAPPSGPRIFSEALTRQLRDNSMARGSDDGIAFIDPLAAALVVDTALMRADLRASVDVSLAPGLGRGMTVIDPRNLIGTPEISVVEAVDTGKLVELYAHSIAYQP